MSESPRSETTALTIEELAQRVRMSVRNLREWRTLGLLPAAEMRGRVGYYDPAVVGRIEAVKRLHAQGFKLHLIRRMLETSDGSSEEVMQLAAALRSAFREEDAPTVEPAEFAKQWGGARPAELRRAVKLGLLRELPDGRLQFASARVARVGEGLRRLGLSLGEALAATAEIRTHLDAVAEVFERVWRRHIWEPFLAAGMPDASYRGLQQTVAEVRPLALEGVVGLFTVAMDACIERAIAREVDRAARRSSRARR